MQEMSPVRKKLLMFHPVIAPYRIDLVNELFKVFDFRLCLMYMNLKSQKFDLKSLYQERLVASPEYLQPHGNFGKLEVLYKVSKILRSYAPDIVLVSEFGLITCLAVVYRFIHRKHYRIVSMVDDSYDMVVNDHYFTHKHKIAQRLLMPYIDQIINVEPRATEWYRKHYGKGIYFPIITDDVIYRERLSRILPISEEYVRKWNLEGKKVLLYVGRLSPEKNLPVAIKAFLNAKVKDGIFLIVGDGPEKEKLKELVRDNNSVLFLGRYEGDALYAWYNISQIFILSSVQEAFGAVTNEALLAGCWSLVSEAAGSNCLIEENSNGNIFSPYNVDTITGLIIDRLNNSSPISFPLFVKPNMMHNSFRKYINVLMQALEDL